MLLQPTLISTKQLLWLEGTLWAEASDLPEPSRVYDDACDVGFTIQSFHTGREVVYVQVGENKDQEGGIESWIFEPVNTIDADLPKLVVWND